jgi:hypothetical protein
MGHFWQPKSLPDDCGHQASANSIFFIPSRFSFNHPAASEAVQMLRNFASIIALMVGMGVPYSLKYVLYRFVELAARHALSTTYDEGRDSGNDPF